MVKRPEPKQPCLQGPIDRLGHLPRLADGANVVLFSRPGRDIPPLPTIGIDVENRAPRLRSSRRMPWLGGFATSLAMHAGLLTMLWNEPIPDASIGTEIISVQVTLGATTAAGLATAAGEHESPFALPIEKQDRDEEEVENPDQPASEATAAPTADELTPIEAAPHKEQPKKETAIAIPTDTASGVGRGRSDPEINYNGSVAAHLNRHKQYPPAARKARAQGIATVTFTLDDRGRVMGVKLATSSGVSSIDHEAVAMVHRASPFPPPPDGQHRDFTVPVRFNLRQ